MVGQLERIPPNGESRFGARRTYRPANEGIREWDPKPRPARAVLLTQRISPSIRTAVGWLYPLEHYDERLTLDPLAQYAELLLILGSDGTADYTTISSILQEARNRLTDREYERLAAYADLLATVPEDARAEAE